MPVFINDMNDSWVDAGITWNAIRMNVINNASAAGSRLIDLLTNGVSQFSVTPGAGVVVGNPTGGAKGAGTINSQGVFVNGTPLGGNVSTNGSAFPGQLAQWLDSFNLVGIDSGLLGYAPINSPQFTGTPTAPTPTVADSSIKIATTAFVKNNLANFQPLDGDLTAISALGGTNTIYYRSGVDTWGPVTFSGLTFTGGVLTVTAAGTGNVSNSGAPNLNELAQWVDGTHIKGLPITTLFASPTFTGNPIAPTQPTATNNTTIATTAFVQANLANFQPVDGDLTAIAALTGTNTIYYRSGTSAWSPVTIGTNLTFVGGTLAATGGGGGDVFKASPNAFTALNTFQNSGVIIGHSASITASYGLELHGTTAAAQFYGSLYAAKWSADANASLLSLNKSRGAAIGTHVATAANDMIGGILFNASNGSVFGTLVQAAAHMSGSVANAGELRFSTNNGAAFAERMRLHSSGGLALGNQVAVDPGAGGIVANSIVIKQLSDSLSGALQIIPTSGVNVGYLFSDASGNLTLTSGNASGSVSIKYNSSINLLALFNPSMNSIKGSNGAQVQSAGYIGEYLSQAATPTALTPGAYTAIGVLTPGAGEWDMVGKVHVTGGTPGATIYASVSTSAAAGTSVAESQTSAPITAAFNEAYLTIGPIRMRQASAFTWYLNVYPSAACNLADAQLQARRVN